MAQTCNEINMNPLSFPYLTYTDNDFMNALKSSESPTSLFNITLVRISRSLWLQDNMRLEIANSCTFYNSDELKNELNEYRNKWWETTRKVFEHIPNLTIPISCRKPLEKMIKFVGDQILHFLYYRVCLDGMKIGIYLDCLRWTSQGMIDKVKTTSLLLEHKGLSTLEKYELACSICSEEKIRYYFSILPEQYFINSFIGIGKFSLMLFWTYLKGEHERLQKVVWNYSYEPVIKSVFEWSFYNKNEVAAQYFLNIDNSIRGNIKYYTKKSIDDSTLLLPYLMAQMTPYQLRELCANDGSNILNRLANDWRLKSYFVPVARYFLQFITKTNLLNAFKIIILCWKENVLENNKCKDLLQEYVHHVRNDNETVIEVVLNPLFSFEAFETIKVLLRKFNVSVKNKIIYSSFGSQICCNLILKNKFSEVEFLLQEMLQSEANIRKFKSSFFQINCFEISSKLTTSSNYQILDTFLILFSNDKGIKKFKLELPYKFDATIIINIFKCKSYVCSDQLKAIDEFLSWCFEGDSSKMSDCKLEVFEVNSKYKELQEQFFKHIFELVIEGELQLVDTYLNWAYCTIDGILKFKTEFFEKKNFKICYSLIVHDKYELLDEFLNMFCVKDEISTYKYTLPIGREGKIIKEFLKMRSSTDAAESIIRFLNYSFAENEKVITYLKEQVLNQGKDINLDCIGIFLEKIPLIGNSLLRDKYMKWAFSTDVKPEVKVEMHPSPETEEYPFNDQFHNNPFNSLLQDKYMTWAFSTDVKPEEYIFINQFHNLFNERMESVDEKIRKRRERRMEDMKRARQSLRDNSSRAAVAVSGSCDGIPQPSSRNLSFRRRRNNYLLDVESFDILH